MQLTKLFLLGCTMLILMRLTETLSGTILFCLLSVLCFIGDVMTDKIN